MSFKLAVKNIKKSIRDYSIYFITLLFAVSLFYMFNSIDAQTSMANMSSSKESIIESLVSIIGYVSVFVAFVLAFLIVYSNNYIVRRRKKELGLYEILGMKQSKISAIFVLETAIVGVASLIAGILLGIFLSQFLSLVVGNMFEVNMDSYKFVFSSGALIKTIICFGIIFILVAIFNVITIKKYKIIDLLNSDKKNEKTKIRNKYVIIISFVLACVMLGCAYYLLLKKDAILSGEFYLWSMILSGSVGTFFLFFSLSGFILRVIEKIKSIYYKGLNIFVLKQTTNKINTSVFSMTVTCLMLLLTVGLLSSSISLTRVFNTDLSENNLFDFTIQIYDDFKIDDEGKLVDKENNMSLESIIDKDTEQKYVKESVLIAKYSDPDVTIGSIISDEGKAELAEKYGDSITYDYEIPLISESEYKEFMEKSGQDKVDISESQYLILENVNGYYDYFNDYYSSGGTLAVNGKELTPGYDKVINTAIENSESSQNDGVIVVSDDLAEGLDITSLSYLGNFIDTSDEEQTSSDFFSEISSPTSGLNSCKGYNYVSRVDSETSSMGIKMIATFLGLYLGLIFAISSATLLAIGQLSEASDNKKRYKVLSQIGADKKMINKALLTQELIVFAFPLIVALIHSFFGLKKINSYITILGNIDISSNILLTALFMIIVYGGYFLVTYLSSRRIIKDD